MAYSNTYGTGAPIDPTSMMIESEEDRRKRLLRESQALQGPVAPDQTGPSQDEILRDQTMAELGGIQIVNRGPNYDNLLNGAIANDRVNTKLLNDPNAPPDVRATAMDAARYRAENQKKEVQANNVLKTGDQTKIAAAIQTDDPGGNYLKLLAYKALGMTNLALQEERKLGAGRSVENVSSPDGKNRARITFDGMGQPIAGYDQTGRALNEAELRSYATYRADSTPMSGLPQKGEFLVDDLNRPFQQIFNPRDPLNPILVPIGHKFEPQGNLVRSTQSPSLAGQVAGGKVIGTTTAEQKGAIPTSVPVLGQDQNVRVPPPPAVQGTPAIQGSVQPSVPAQTTVGTQPAVPATQPVQTAPIDPNAPKPNIVASTPQLNPAITATPKPAAGGVLPAGQYKEEQAARQAARGEAIQTAETEPRENIKANTALATEASKKARDAASQLSTIDRVIKYTETKPKFFGEWIGSDAYRAFRDSRTKDEDREALNRLAQAAKITTPTERAEFQKLLNDIRRLELSGITGSGLSATQLNTERESQRAVSAFAVSITDTAQAAKAQAMIARTGIEYNRAFNKYLGTANKRLSPATLQDDFDQRFGDKIYMDLQKKLEAEIPNQSGAAGNNSGFSVLRRRPVQ